MLMADELDTLDFSDLAPKQRLVIGPDKEKYFLITASVDATVKYRSAAAKAGKWENVKGEDGKESLKVVGFNDIADQELVLVSNTLAESEGGKGERVLADKSGNAVLVPAARIRRWHGEVIAKLYSASLALSPWLKKGDEDGEEGKAPLPKDSSADGADSSK
jgi:hypothetical protein